MEVCKVFDCNRTSLMRWVKLYDQNNLQSKHNKTRKSIIPKYIKLDTTTLIHLLFTKDMNKHFI